MTANGFSNHELFTKKVDFSAPVRCYVPPLAKTHFFNLLELLDIFTETLFPKQPLAVGVLAAFHRNWFLRGGFFLGAASQCFV